MFEGRMYEVRIMNEGNILQKYFSLTEQQERQFAALGVLYPEWNAKINVISRKDIDSLYEHHILHSLAIAKWLGFKQGSEVMDVGTGGGFPGVPLAIMFPDVQFTLIDSVGKKVRVAEEISRAIGLRNVRCIWERAEDEKGKYDFVVSRAVMPLADLHRLVQKNISRTQRNALPNGIIALKGGELQGEIQRFRNTAETEDISNWFDEEYFKTKKIVYLPC